MIDVSCAIIRNEENEILVVQRGEKTDHPFLWEFPGGKLHEGESPEDCIIREISEELSMEIVVCERLADVEYDYGHKQIRLFPFICDTLDELPFLSEHIAFRWVASELLKEVNLCEADMIVSEGYLDRLEVKNEILHEGKENSPDQISDDSGVMEMINNIQSTREAEWIANSALENSRIFHLLIKYSRSPEQRLAFRSSWILTKVCEKEPEIIYPRLSEIIDDLDELRNESVIRSFLRIISFSSLDDISEKQKGKLADYCFNALNNGSIAVAIKAFAMEILYKLTLFYPQLANELVASIRILMEDGSAGIVARGRMILKKINAMPTD